MKHVHSGQRHRSQLHCLKINLVQKIFLILHHPFSFTHSALAYAFTISSSNTEEHVSCCFSLGLSNQWLVLRPDALYAAVDRNRGEVWKRSNGSNTCLHLGRDNLTPSWLHIHAQSGAFWLFCITRSCAGKPCSEFSTGSDVWKNVVRKYFYFPHCILNYLKEKQKQQKKKQKNSNLFYFYVTSKNLDRDAPPAPTLSRMPHTYLWLKKVSNLPASHSRLRLYL